ncbi:MAG: HNH endonuclease signature motif containing protein [Methanolinea sp.]|jgi:hypothetical protein|nr:HNH endonuclease signature motif containing protein [Methanolinea sp.]
MSMLPFLLSHPAKANSIKRAAGCRCEICGSPGTEEELEIHSFSIKGEENPRSPEDLEGSLLVLCARCHADLHESQAGIADQELLARARDREVSRKIRKILAFQPGHVSPPDSDVQGAYLDACASRYGNLI